MYNNSSSRCPFCNKISENFRKEGLEDEGPEFDCHCSGFSNRYHCRSNGCSQRKERGEDYCWKHIDHKNHCEYGPCTRNKELGKYYCSEHRNECRRCGERNWIEEGLCHKHRCSECYREISSSGYCSDHINSCSHCRKRITKYEERCQECVQKYRKCKYSCPKMVLSSEEYCSSHKKKCEWNCTNRTSENERFCREHTSECEFDKCPTRISSNSKNCSDHPPQEQARLYKEEKDNLQHQLNTANNQLKNKKEAIEWLKNELKMLYVDEEQYQAWIEENYIPRFGN